MRKHSFRFHGVLSICKTVISNDRVVKMCKTMGGADGVVGERVSSCGCKPASQGVQPEVVPLTGRGGFARPGVGPAVLTLPPAVAGTVAGRAVMLQGMRAGLECAMRTRSQHTVCIDEQVHGQDSHSLRYDEGKSAAVEAPAVPVTALGLALVGVASVGRDVHDNANDVAET